MSFGMFCAIPLPFQIWDEKCLNLVLPCFPFVGAFIGVLWWAILKLLLLSGIPLLLLSAVAMLIPFIFSGFLHLDGYMDTSDAVLSRRPLEDKLRILKDPHTGSFAVIMLAILFVLQFAAFLIIAEKNNYLELLIIIPVISRCCSAMSVLCLRPMKQSGMANMFRQNTGAGHKVFITLIFVLAAAFSFFSSGIKGFIVAVFIMAGFAAALACTYRDLKGISGDLAGHALVIGELSGLIVMAVF